jgi:hypothetical protein
MTRYHYVTVPATDVYGAATLCTEPDSFIADDEGVRAVRDLLHKGYRWVRSEQGLAIFEKKISFRASLLPIEK